MSPALILEATAFNRSQLIVPDAPQVALAGRSNVGKSSLVNALAGRRQLAKTSATPGKTRSINYYRVQPGNGYVVDLPGYGYARCSKEERARWAAFMELYLTQTPGLAGLALLLDARLAPQESDKQMAFFALESRLPLFPVLTKADKCAARELERCKRQWSALLPAQHLLVTSSQKRTGIDALWTTLLQALANAPAHCGNQALDS